MQRGGGGGGGGGRGGGEGVEGGTRYTYIKQLLKSDKINFTRTPSE